MATTAWAFFVIFFALDKFTSLFFFFSNPICRTRGDRSKGTVSDTNFSQTGLLADLRICNSFRVKQYLLFTYYVSRSLGGAKDFLDSFDSVEEALDNILAEPMRYYQVVDRDTMETVKEGLARFKHCTPEGFDSGD